MFIVDIFSQNYFSTEFSEVNFSRDVISQIFYFYFKLHTCATRFLFLDNHVIMHIDDFMDI